MEFKGGWNHKDKTIGKYFIYLIPISGSPYPTDYALFSQQQAVVEEKDPFFVQNNYTLPESRKSIL